MQDQYSNQPPPQQPQQPFYPPYYMYQQKKKSKWWIPVAIILGVILVAIIGMVAFFSSITSSFNKPEVSLHSNSVLYLNYSASLDEYTSKGAFDFLSGRNKASFHDVLTAIKTAKYDNNIKGIFYKASIADVGFAKAMELQDAIVDFKKSGKFFYAFIEAGREIEYFQALPADKIFMSSEGFVELNGFGASAMFFKGFFDKIGVNFDVEQYEDFKSAGEQFSRKSFSDSARKEMQVLLQQRTKIFVDAVAKYRKLDPQFIYNVLSRGVYTADSLTALGFIDQMGTEAVARNKVKELVYGGNVSELTDKKLNLITPGDYLSTAPSLPGKKADQTKRIAIIYGVGTIQSSPSNNILGGDKLIASQQWVKYLKKAREDKSVKAIILRIDSPGGSVIASDEIREEVIATRKVKPIYASMSDVAASGGYYISMDCDTIIAHPATITGSIGVIMMIPNVSGLLKKLDITADTISTSPAANFMNGSYPITDKDKQKLHALGRGTYDRFLNKVAAARHKTYDEIREVAKGHVWSGEDAYKHGLVDVLGGIDSAIAICKRRIGISDSTKVSIRTFPEEQEGMEAFIKIFNKNKDDDDAEESILSLASKCLNTNKDVLTNVYNTMPNDIKKQINYCFELFFLSEKEKILMASPYYYNLN